MPSFYSSLDSFDKFFLFPPENRPVLAVISAAQLKEWKADQTKREIQTLEELVEGHRLSISQLQSTIAILKKDLPDIETSSDEPVG